MARISNNFSILRYKSNSILSVLLFPSEKRCQA